MTKPYSLNNWGKSARVPIPLHIWEKLKEKGWTQKSKVYVEYQDGKIIVSKEEEDENN